MSVKILDEFIGKTIQEIHVSDKKEPMTIMFIMSDEKILAMEHAQDCCEYVYLADVVGDMQDIVGLPLVMAEVVTYDDGDEDMPPLPSSGDGMNRWTYYKFATQRGYVTLRWYGTSNGYYSVGVDIYEATRPTNFDNMYGVNIYKAANQLPFH